MQMGQFYSVPGQYQSLLAPRMSSIDIGANVMYSLPDQKHMAVPKNPLTFGKMVAENYTPGVGKAGNGGNGLASANSMDGSGEVLRSQVRSEEYPDVSDMIPVGDMTTMNALGETEQPIVYDRLIHANRNSRLRGQGDPIRGDLAIVPRTGELWAPAVHPTVDLQQGALNVMAGPNNDAARSMTQLMNLYSSGTDTEVAGMNMTQQFKETDLGAGLSDITVTAFA